MPPENSSISSRAVTPAGAILRQSVGIQKN